MDLKRKTQLPVKPNKLKHLFQTNHKAAIKEVSIRAKFLHKIP